MAKPWYPGKTGPKPVPLIDRVDFEIDDNGCWNWVGRAFHKSGYGRTQSDAGKAKNAHRAVYEAVVEAVPDGLHLDHLCRNRACVNPDHMEPVTPRENLLRGESSAAQAARRDSCIHGHPFTEENTYLWRGSRLCRTCRRGEPKLKREFPCGTRVRYRRGCRCDQCRAANAAMAREQRARKKAREAAS